MFEAWEEQVDEGVGDELRVDDKADPVQSPSLSRL
jgi:hypothetical protein